MRRPIASMSCATVVSGGVDVRAASMSSKPTTATSAGHGPAGVAQHLHRADRHEVVGREDRVEIGHALEQRVHRRAALTRC